MKETGPDRRMAAGSGGANPRKVIGAAALVLLILAALVVHYLLGIPQEDWDLAWSFAFGVGVCVAFFMAFYDRKNLPEKTWDFNPGRGVQYFFIGLILFPVLAGIDAMTGADIGWIRMTVGTLVMSVLVGIAGTFTENVGI